MHPDSIPIAGMPTLIAAAGAIGLGAALVGQFVFDLSPCVLCIHQRWPYVAAIVFGLAAHPIRAPARAVPVALAAIGFWIGAGIAAFHVGVERGWWRGTSGCGGSLDFSSPEALKARLLAAPAVRCEDVAWELFGISMAGYNVLASLILGALASYGAYRLKGARN